jgi:transcriptional regulator with XRE-family HTH domain
MFCNGTIIITRAETLGGDSMKPMKNFRLKQGLTQQQIADKLGINRVTYTKIELGYRNPDLIFMKKFEEVFRLSPKQMHNIFFAPTCSDAETSTGTEGS